MDRVRSEKVYCEECDTVFNSQSEYYCHLPEARASESCPIDSAVSKIARILHRLTRTGS